MINFPYVVPALRVEQPIGVYYVALLPARLLLEVAFSDALSATLGIDGVSYGLDGTQRLPQPKRLQPIADYIDRADAAFPNSIILAANYRNEDGLLEEDEDEDDDEPRIARRWTVEESDSCYTLTIPTKEKLAAIIDGQHRLFAFALADKSRLDMTLICSIFLDLPKPFQAQLFATINSTQKPVDKSLTYELFGYNLDEEDEEYWSPDKLAVFLSRRLVTDPESPLKGRIVIAPKKDQALEMLGEGKAWKVSTAVVVEGIMRLYTSNPKKDNTNLLHEERKNRAAITDMRKDKSPLREVYISNQDTVLYTMVLNYLKACNAVFWENAKPNSFIVKTVGIQALFDILKKLSHNAYSEKNISTKYFTEKLSAAGEIDFSSIDFRNASGSGRSIIRRAIEQAIE